MADQCAGALYRTIRLGSRVENKGIAPLMLTLAYVESTPSVFKQVGNVEEIEWLIALSTIRVRWARCRLFNVVVSW